MFASIWQSIRRFAVLLTFFVAYIFASFPCLAASLPAMLPRQCAACAVRLSQGLLYKHPGPVYAGFAGGTVNDGAASIGSAICSASRLNVRLGPSTRYRVVNTVLRNSSVLIYSMSGRWYRIGAGSAQGWVYGGYLRQMRLSSASDEVAVDEPAQTTAAVQSLIDKYKGTVSLINWFGPGGVREIWKRGSAFTMIDVRTGAEIQMKYWRGSNHADIETATRADTALLKQCFGGRWSWARRPVWVIIGGKAYAGSINGMPHGGKSIRNNGLNGQICLHFKGSKTHTNAKVCPLHQSAVMEAFRSGE